MFYKTSEEKETWYKVKRVKTGTTSKGDNYTFISIAAKDKQSDSWHNCTLYVWAKVKVKEGDSVSITEISAFDYKETEVGLKKYLDLQATVKVKVKPCEESDSADDSAPVKKPAKQPSARTVANTDDAIYGGVDDDEIPF